MRKLPRKGRKTANVMTGGPLDGQTLWLSCAGTVSFTLNGQTGRYDANNRWIEESKKKAS